MKKRYNLQVNCSLLLRKSVRFVLAVITSGRAMFPARCNGRIGIMFDRIMPLIQLVPYDRSYSAPPYFYKFQSYIPKYITDNKVNIYFYT
jgi:hypothetical protein